MPRPGSLRFVFSLGGAFSLASLSLLSGVAGCSDAPDGSRAAALPPAFPGGTPAAEMAPAANAPAPAGAAASPTNSGDSTSGTGSETTGNLPLQPTPPAAGPSQTPAPENPGASAPAPATLSRVLVFTRTLGYRHDSIGAGVMAIQKLGAENAFAVDQTEDATRFSDATLADYDVVVFLSTTADVLDDTQQAAFQRYIEAGGGWVGVHAATDTEYDWAWYGQLIGNGAWFQEHPAIQTAQLDVETRDHASTAHLPARFPLQDEWYNFRANPRTSVTVLLRLDETSYMPGPGAMGDHPIAWFHEFDGGRAWYTALGHRIELYTDPQFTQHLLGGLRWAAGL